jgi:vacuolar protein sorting-associated protein IST1
MQEQVTNGEKQNKHKPEIREEENVRISVNEGKGDEFSDSFKGKKKYKDVADAAQAAFESAAYAAAAARAAVELSRFQSYDDDDDHDDGHNSSSHQPRKVLNENDSVKAMSSLKREEFNKNTEELEKVNSSSSSDADEIVDEIKINSGVVLESKMQSSAFIDLEKRPLSVRTRRVHGY